MADTTALTLAFMRSHPTEAARILEAASPAAMVELLARVPARIGGAVLNEMLPRTSARALLALPEERAIEVLADLGSRSAAAVLRHVQEPTRARFIAGLPTAAALAAKLLLEYVDDSVGSCMDPNVVALPTATRVGDALDRVRNAKSRVEWIFCVDERRHLLGWIPLAELVRAPELATLETLSREPVGRLPAHAPLVGALAHPAWQRASILPVEDRSGRLIGVLARDELDRAANRWLQKQDRPDTSQESLAGLLVQGYWQGFSGLLQLFAAGLPAARPLGRRDHER